MVDSQQTSPALFASPHKRPYSSCASHQSNSATAPSLKKQKLHTAVLAPTFWDGLSRAHLTKNALRELDRRNARQGQLERRKQNGCFDRLAIPYGQRRRSQRIAEKNHRRSSVDEILESLTPNGIRGLKRFASHGGPALAELRGHCVASIANAGMSSGQSSLGRRKRGSRSPSKNNTPHTSSTRSTGPYDRAFQQHLIDHNVLPDGYEYPDGRAPPEPENMQEILDILARPRASLSPSRFSHNEFRKFKRADTNASKERQVTASIIPIIEGGVSNGKCVAGEIPLANLHPLTDGTLVPGNPDLYYGARPEQLDRSIRKQLGGYVVPSTQDDLPILPNFFVEVKGPDGSVAVAKRQLTYDMSLGARGLRMAESYGKSGSSFDNHARTLGCTYQDGTLKMYANHPIPPSTTGSKSETQPGYVTTQLKAWALSSDLETFRQGAAAYRNGKDWAKQQRNRVIDQANKMIDETTRTEDQGLVSGSDASATNTFRPSSQDTATYPASTISAYDPDSSADELGSDFGSKRFKTRDKLSSHARTVKSLSNSGSSDE